MTPSRFQAAAALACLVLAGCVEVKTQGPGVGAPQRDVLMTRTPGAVQPGWAEPLQRLAYQDNTTNWSYGAAIDIDRDLARSSDKNAAPIDTRIRARIALAYSLSSIGEVGEAKAELEDADAELKANTAALPLLERRLLPVDLLIGRSIVAGAEGAQAEAQAQAARSPRLVESFGEKARTAYAQAAALAHEAAAQASQPMAGEGQAAADAAAAERVGQDIRLDPEKTNLYNSRNRPAGFGDIVARPMTGGEKLLVLQIRARYAEATALLAVGRTADAAAVNDGARTQMQVLNVGVADWLRAELEAQQAEISRRQGDPARAEAVLKQSLAILRMDQGQSGLEAFLDRELAQAAVARGDTVVAKDAEAASFKILIDRYDELHPSRKELGAYLTLLAPGAAVDDQAEVERFFEVASVAVETETARAVQDVAARFSAGDDATGRAMRAMQAASADLRSAQARLARIRGAAKVSPETQKAAEAEELAARQALAQRTADFVKTAGARAGAVLSPLTTISAVQSALRPHEAYLRYVFLDDGRGYAILVLKDRARVVDLKLSAREAETQMTFLRSSADTSDPSNRSFDLQGAHDLYARLFAGLGSDLKGVDALVIEPAGPLFSLPFGALVTAAPTPEQLARAAKDDYAGVPWLAREKALELSVSAAGFVRLRAAPRSHAPKPILAFADPMPLTPAEAQPQAARIAADRIAADTAGAVSAQGDTLAACTRETEALLTFPRLPDTREEAQAAIADLGGGQADLVAGQAFTAPAVRERRDLDQYRLILFATHAALPRRASCWRNPFLFTTLGSGAQSSGALETTEIAQLTLDADLVVLSACNTGAAGASGQALGGLAQSFIFAGARGVVVSHWEADSKGAALLMRRMYAGLAQGDTPSLALMQAQRAMMQTPGYAHPYYWALFTTVGGASTR